MKIKPVLNFLSLVSIIFSSGCASEPQTGHPSNKAWYQAGISAEQTRRDLADCQNEALVNGRSYSPIPADSAGASIALGMLASSAENSRENQIVQTCMTAKGYSLVNTNSPLLTIIPIANMTTAQFKVANDKIAAKAEAGDAGAQYQLGSLYYTGDFGVTKDFTEAIKWYQKAYDQNYPNMQLPLASAYTQRGNLKQMKGDLDGALADFNKAIEIKPDFTEVYCVRGYVKQCEGDLDGAFADYNKVIEMNPRLAYAYFSRGLLNYNSHKFTDAMADFNKSRELGLDAQQQDYSSFYIWLIQARLGEQDTATKELQTYLDNRKIGTPDDWPSKVASFLAGQLSEPDFFKAAENSDQQTNNGQHCEAYFYAGSKRLVEGDKITATDYFNKCLATELKSFEEYGSAAAELNSLGTSKQ
jgi:lipoprotein NlpI